MPLVLAVCVSPILNCMIFSGANRVSDLFLRKILQSGSVGLRSESRAAANRNGRDQLRRTPRTRY
jgi:hypothetical protein